ncbi:mannose-1-phosphate guanylyltransferase/mannose-1-phosphate guanylyltransferase / mannose-6-phosphate isomerase [Faunimonas pinastri]|uniref:mannose-1-phosphate guanylyltransferase n=1 Tax=Faunimonas pinastri TaxID=1855383 RepID=A0A1H9PHN5_9HYPH|nr:mannose-1-phosphate guanylyltransferase/mannose-6-phosphate isomerase [Faunimonas pinastri]SER47369.1 mannose-1-phosphate guanylyltransferase/mannose-1-phosphate guanylyltransferase / mannose-6-phosphate isomerase [Faunimonas pinastri]
MSRSGTKIIPVLLSGGTGSRLWPLSRETYPKQLLSLTGTETLLQQSAKRASDPERFGRLMVVANAEHRFLIAEQLRTIRCEDAEIVLEPSGRNTAAAAAVAALLALKEHADPLVLLMPADHVVSDVDAFLAALDQAADAAATGSLLLFGIRPSAPSTAYGYIRTGDRLDPEGEVRKVDRFVEKPDLATAEDYLASGDYLWNSGIFLCPAKVLIDELTRFAPKVVEACRAAVQSATRDLDFLRLGREAFMTAPSISLDYAVMEHTDRAAIVPSDFAWTDVGSWSALWEIGEQDADGNVLSGEVIAEETSGSYIRGEGQLVATLGVKDLIVVATGDVVLVADREHDQDVKRIVERLKREGHESAIGSRRVHRPWGAYQCLHEGDRFQVKSITVNPGAKLSLQKHFHRAEHWVVVNGTALVTRDEEEILLRENESLFLPLGCVHRLANPGRLPLNLIEVQSGAYLGEDDIVRFEDDYARTEEVVVDIKGNPVARLIR